MRWVIVTSEGELWELATPAHLTGGSESLFWRTPEVVSETEPAGGSLNPDWVEWLMGLPIGWTDIEAEPVEHPGWDDDPAEMWPTPSAGDGGEPRTDRYIELGYQIHTSTAARLNNGEDKLIPRLTTRKDNRANRLKACGNGVVPQQAALALRLLLGLTL